MTSLRLVVTLTYPDKTTDIKVASELTIAQLKEAAGKALKLDTKDYSFTLIAFGEDARQLNQGENTKITIKPDSTLVVITPPGLLPVRKKQTDEKETPEDDRFKGLTPDNIFTKLAKAKGKARTNAFEYLDTYTSDILKSRSWLRLPKAHVMAVAKRDSLNVPEAELFDAIIAWATEAAKKAGEKPTAEAIKSTIGTDLLYLIRFPLMTTEDLAAKVTPHNLLTPQQVLELFTYLAQKDLGGTPGSSLSVFNLKARQGSGRYGKAGTPMPEGSWKVSRIDGTWSYGAYDNCHSSYSVQNAVDLDQVTGYLTGRSLTQWKSGEEYNLPRGSSTTDRCGIYSYPSSSHGIEFQFLKGSNLVRSIKFYCTRLERGVTLRILSRKTNASWGSDLMTGTLPFLSNGGGQKQWVEVTFSKPQLADEFRFEFGGGQCAMHCLQFINGP